MNEHIAAGREQLESAILNFPGMVPDDINLSAFMDDEQVHRIKSAVAYKNELLALISGGGEHGAETPWPAFDGKFEFRPSELTVWSGYKGHGKALSLDTEIPTPEGWSVMGDIKVGDRVFDESGNVCNVVAKTGVMEGRPCYKITFSDGTEIVADEQHEWLTNNYKSRTSETHNRANNKQRISKSMDQQHKRILPSIVTTKDICKTLKVYEGKKAEALNHAIDAIVSAVKFTGSSNLQIPPYVMGAWLGDGSKSAALLTCAYSDLELIENIRSLGVEIKEVSSSNSNTGLYRMNCGISGKKGTGMSSVLNGMNLINNKHVPVEYMQAKPSDRMELLRGLLDTDGHVDKFGRVEFCNTNKNLAYAVKELAASFGIVPTLITGRATLYGKDCGIKYRVFFVTNLPVFKLSRKLNALKQTISIRNKRRFIVSCEPVESVPVQCIQVDSASHLYLASRSFIPTHNSLIISQALEKFISNGQKVFIISPEFPAHRVLHRMLIQSLGVHNCSTATASHWLDAVDGSLWIYDQQSSLKPRDIPALCRYAVEMFGVDHILIDSLMKCGLGTDDYSGQKNLVDAVQQVAHKSKVHIHLVAHGKKAGDEKMGGLHDVKGASEIADMAENVLICWRNKAKELTGEHHGEPDCIVKVEAQRNGDGWIGSVPLFFRKSSFTFHGER